MYDIIRYIIDNAVFLFLILVLVLSLGSAISEKIQRWRVKHGRS